MPPDARVAVLDAMVGSAPSPEAMVRVAVNAPSPAGTGPGNWREASFPSAEAAALLSLSPRSLEKYRRRGAAPKHVFVGRHFGYRRSEIERRVAAAKGEARS